MITKIKKLAPYLIFSGICTLIILKSKIDMWDSSIIEYGLMTNNLTGIKIMSFESGWIFQYYWVLVIKNFANILFIKYKFMNLIIIIGFGITIISEIKYISIKVFKIDKDILNVGLLFFSTFPIWDIFLSSILAYHFSFMALGFLSVRLIYSSKCLLIKILGWVLLTVSFNLNSLMLFLPTLGYVYDKSIYYKKYISLNTLIIFIIGFTEYIIYKLIYPPYGVYYGYNKINFDIYVLIKSSLINLTNFLPIIFAIVIFIVLRKRFVNSLISLAKKKEALYILILIISSIGPYILVGRSHNFINPTDWDGRQILVLLPILTILYSLILSEISKFHISNYLNFYIIPIALTCLLILNIIHKLNRQVFEEDLITLLKTKNKQINSFQKIQIIGNTPGPSFRFYESNLLFYKSTGNIYHITNISDKRIEKMNYPYLANINKYASFNIFEINNIIGTDEIIINIYTNGYSSFQDMFLNTLGLNQNKYIKILSTHKI
jgi:hypothetical protein